MDQQNVVLAHAQQSRLMLQRVWQTLSKIRRIVTEPNLSEHDKEVLQWRLYARASVSREFFKFVEDGLFRFIEYVNWFRFANWEIESFPSTLLKSDLGLTGRIEIYKRSVYTDFVTNDTMWNEYYIWSNYVAYEAIIEKLRFGWIISRFKTIELLRNNIADVSQFLYNVLGSKWWTRGLKVLCDYYKANNEVYKELVNEAKVSLVLKN